MSGMEQAAAPTIDQDGVVSGGLDEAYSVYQDALRQIFYNIQEGRLTEASISVLDVSDWLLTNVVRLGTLLHCLARKLRTLTYDHRTYRR